MPSAYSVSFARANGEPLFSSHMLDLSEEFDEENIATCVKYFKVFIFALVIDLVLSVADAHYGDYFHCSQVGPHLRDPVPMGTFFSFWVPISVLRSPFSLFRA